MDISADLDKGQVPKAWWNLIYIYIYIYINIYIYIYIYLCVREIILLICTLYYTITSSSFLLYVELFRNSWWDEGVRTKHCVSQQVERMTRQYYSLTTCCPIWADTCGFIMPKHKSQQQILLVNCFLLYMPSRFIKSNSETSSLPIPARCTPFNNRMISLCRSLLVGCLLTP